MEEDIVAIVEVVYCCEDDDEGKEGKGGAADQGGHGREVCARTRSRWRVAGCGLGATINEDAILPRYCCSCASYA